MEVMEEIMDAFSFEVPRRGCKVDTWSCRTCLVRLNLLSVVGTYFVLTDIGSLCSNLGIRTLLRGICVVL